MGLSHRLINIISNQRGQLLIEILLAIAITAIMLPALLTGLFASKQGKAQQGQRVQAVALMKEAEEVVRNVRDQGWSVFSVNGTYHPLISGSSWVFASGGETINGLTRTITVSDVYRDSNGAIVTTGGTFDPSTKKSVCASYLGTTIHIFC
jgi:type II secretory pathway pseudopilin PulG